MLEDLGVSMEQAAEFAFEATGGPWRVRGFRLEEQLGGTYVGRVALVHDVAMSDPFALDGTPCKLAISRGGVVTRTLLGLGRRTTLEGWTESGQLLASVEVVPAFAFLDVGSDLRWFRDQTTPDILRTVLGDGLGRYTRRVDAQLVREKEDPAWDFPYAVRETCTQYHESDFSFARRLMADEGITAFYDHSGAAEVLVLVDDNGAFPKLRESPVRVLASAGRGHALEAISTFTLGSNTTPARVILQDQDLTRPRVPLQRQRQPHEGGGRDAAGPKPYTREARYQYPAGLTFTRLDAQTATYQGTDLEIRSRLRFEESQGRARVASGKSDVSGFAPGFTFRIATGYPLIDGEYLLVSVTHHGAEPAPAEAAGSKASAGAQSVGRRYWNEFECVPLGTPYRPPPLAKPVGNLDRAIIVGPSESGDFILTEKRGHVKVNFVGNREERESTPPDETRSAWIPVAQGWLGAGMGQRIIPRRGMEVLVGYQEGDPDRPVVLACLPTGANVIPYKLPDEKTRTVFFRTASVPTGPPNFSELSVDDARDKEEVFFRAARDFDKVVLHDETAEIKHDEKRTVRNKQEIHVHGERERSVAKDETVTVEGSRTVTVKTDEKHVVTGKRETEITGLEKLTAHANRTTEIEGSEEIHVAHHRTVTVDEVLTVKQGPTTVEWAEGHVDLNAGSWIKLKHASAEIFVDTAGNVKITTAENIEVQGKNIHIAGEKVLIEGSQEVRLSAGSGELKLDASGAAISGTKVSSSGQMLNEINAALVKIN